MASESISIPILTPGANDAARNIKQVGDAAAGTGGKLDFAAGSLKLFNDQAAKAAKADATLTNAFKTHTKATQLLSDAENVLAGKATTTTRLFADQQQKLSGASKATADAGKAAASAAGGFGSLAGSGGIGGGGLVAVGAAAAAILGPVLAVSGVGLGGLALAALAAGKNSKQFAAELQPLKNDLASFQQQLRPVVLSDFGKAAGLAQTALHDLEPAAAGAGKALGQVLDQVGATFHSGAFIQFFQFIGQQAGPDTRLLGNTFVDLLKVLPPVIEGLHSVSVEAVNDLGGILKLVKGVEDLAAEQHHLQQEAANSSGILGRLRDAAIGAAKDMVPGAFAAKTLAGGLAKLGASGNAAAQGTAAAALGAVKAHAPFFDLNKDITTLNSSMTTLVGNLTTLQGDDVSWQQSLQAAKKQLDSNTAGLAGNSKNALANRAAVIQSTQAAISFASNQLTLGKNIGQASNTIQDQIRWLQSLHSNSSTVRQELEALRKEEQLLEAQRIRQTIQVQGLGQWSVSQSLAPGSGHRRALGGLIPGSGSGDSYPALLTPGEVVVPKPMVSSGAVDHLRGSLPGFAAGGLVGKYAGSVSGLAPWIKRDDQATISLIDQSVVRATAAGIRAAAAAAATSGFGAPGPGGGAPAANAALAHRLYASQLTPASWEAWNAVAMAESGWNQFARNPSSGAYGIPQALPPGKMGAAANPPQSNPAAQINWMWNYMRASYGGPLGAEAHENAFHWYGSGLKGIFRKPTVIGVGERGPEMVSVTPLRGGGGGNTYVIHNHVAPNANMADVGRVTVQAIREFERRSGNSWRQS